MNTADIGEMIPMVLFVCIVMAIKFIVDARVRKQMMENHVDQEMIKSMLEADEQSRRLSALKWGLVMTAVGIAFCAVDLLHMQYEKDGPGALGLVVFAAGAGMLAYHAIANRAKKS